MAWPMAHNRKIVGSSLVSAQLVDVQLKILSGLCNDGHSKRATDFILGIILH